MLYFLLERRMLEFILNEQIPENKEGESDVFGTLIEGVIVSGELVADGAVNHQIQIYYLLLYEK
jgi:hypothetical protein